MAAVAFERVDRMLLVEFDGASRLVLEFGELHHLHQVFLDVDHQVETVADHDAVGLDVRRDLRHVGLGPRRCAREEQRYCKKSFHRCLNSFISSDT